MKYLFLLILIIVVFVYGCNNHEGDNLVNVSKEKNNLVKNDLQLLGLKGNISTLRQEEFRPALNENIIGTRTGDNSFSYKFDASGCKIQEQNYDSLGRIKSTAKYQFSEKGLKLEKNIVDLNNNLIKSHQYEYNKLGQVFKYNVTEIINGEKSKYYILINFDEHGNEVSETIFTPNGDKFANALKVFKNNNLVQITLFDNLDSPTSICTYENDKFGNPIIEKYSFGNGIPYETHKNEYLYDSIGNWIKKINFLAEKHMTTEANSNKNIGVQSITFRTLTYFNQ